MPEFNFAVFATFCAQTFGAGVMALLLFGFVRQYRKSYLLAWALGWSAFAVYHLAEGTSFVLAERFAPSHPLQVFVSLVSGISGYLVIGWLLFGAYELVRRRPVRIRQSQWILTALATIGAISSLLLLVTH